MSLDPTSVRTEEDGDVVARLADETGDFLAEVNNDGALRVFGADFDLRDLTNDTDDILIYGYDGAANQPISVNPDGEVDVNVLTQPFLDSADDSVEVLQATHDNLNANANIQIGEQDVSPTNPVPVFKTDEGGFDPHASYEVSGALAAQSSETLSFPISTNMVGRLEQVLVASEAPWKAEIVKYDGASEETIAVLKGEAGDTETYKPFNRDADLYSQENQGADEEFRVIVTNNNKGGIGQSHEVHVTFEWDERQP